MNLDALLTGGLINMERAEIIDSCPLPMPREFEFQRVRGMMLGLAIGDALGNTTESMSPADRCETMGEIRDYVPHPYLGDDAIGVPTDDTQLAFWTLEHYVNQGGMLEPEKLLGVFASRHIYGVGQTLRQAIYSFQLERPWYECGPASAGNGALMRIAPVIVPHLAVPSPLLWEDAAIASFITHNDRASLGACLAFVAMLWDLLRMTEPPPPEWWLERYVEVASTVEGASNYRPRSGNWRGLYEGPVWAFVRHHVAGTLREGVGTLEACERFQSGAYLLETIPSALYILARHGHDAEEAIVRAVNDTSDNDTVGAIVGAAVGALHGEKALPSHWVTGLSGRTRDDDDGRIFQLLDEAEGAFWIPGE